MTSKPKKYLFYPLLGTFIIFILCLIYANIEARNIKLKEMTFQSKDIPDAFVGKKIIFISDIHSDKYFTKKDIVRLVERINKRNPDIIIIGGDHTLKDTVYSRPFFDEIRKLNSRYGVYTVLGNHDYWEDAKLIQKGLIDCGFHICDNESYWITEGNDSIKIGGVGDFWEDVQVPENTTSDVSKKDFCILLSHNPDFIETFNSDLVDLMLSGHTHAGQVTFFGLYAPVMPATGHPEYLQTGQKYRYGWVEKGKTKLYITSGIGMGGFPFRFFASPEITEMTLSQE